LIFLKDKAEQEKKIGVELSQKQKQTNKKIPILELKLNTL